MSVSEPNAFIGVHFYSCMQPSSSCSVPFWTDIWRGGAGDLSLSVEEIGWKVYALGDPDYQLNHLDFQRSIDAIGREMQRRMELGYGLGRCVLLIKIPILDQLGGCVKVLSRGCQKLQKYILQSWQQLLHRCLTGVSQCNANGECSNPADQCRELRLPDLLSDDVLHNRNRENGVVRGSIFWHQPGNPDLNRVFSLALDQNVSVEAREPSCKDVSLSGTVLAIPWAFFHRSNAEGTTVKIQYVSQQETQKISKEALGSVFITGSGSLDRRYSISMIHAEARVEEIGNLLLALDLKTLQKLQVPKRTLSLFDFKKAVMQAALLSENSEIQKLGIQWQQEDWEKDWQLEKEQTRRIEAEEKKPWWQKLA